MYNSQAITRLEDQLTALRNSAALVCPFPRVSGTFSDLYGSGNANVIGCQSFMNHGKRIALRDHESVLVITGGS